MGTQRAKAVKLTVVCNDHKFSFETRQFNIGEFIRKEMNSRFTVWGSAVYWIGEKQGTVLNSK